MRPPRKSGKSSGRLVATASEAWTRAYERSFADARRLPFLLRLTPATFFFVAYKQLRYLPEGFREAKKHV
jgi:hypothetical protein